MIHRAAVLVAVAAGLAACSSSTNTPQQDGSVADSTSTCGKLSESCIGPSCCPIAGFEGGCDGGDNTCKVMVGGPCQRDSDCMGGEFIACVGFTCCGKTGAGICSTSDATACCSGGCDVMFCQ